MVGNMTILASSSDTWSKINEILENSNSIGTKLPLSYPELFEPHDTLVYTTFQPSSAIRNHTVRSSRERRRTRRTAIQPTTGAVKLSCDNNQNVQATTTLACGHTANTSGQDSSKIKCNFKTTEKLSCGHVHHVLCGERGNTQKCGFFIKKKLKCGHLIQGACHKLPTERTCPAKMIKTFPCGHRSQVPCHQQHCLRTSPKKFSCGHEVQVICRLHSELDLSKVQCIAKVKKVLPCKHEVEVCCKDKHLKMECPGNVERKFSCGHLHRYPCSEVIAKKCGSPVKKQLPCGHIQHAACHQNPTSIKCKHLVTIDNTVIHRIFL